MNIKNLRRIVLIHTKFQLTDIVVVIIDSRTVMLLHYGKYFLNPQESRIYILLSYLHLYSDLYIFA